MSREFLPIQEVMFKIGFANVTPVYVKYFSSVPNMINIVNSFNKIKKNDSPMSKQIYLPLKDEEMRVQAARCMDCRIPYCHGAGCPVLDLIPDFNDLICRRRWRDALALFYTKNPFPEITGHICPALCEAACVHSIDDAAVPIRQIELSLTEKGFAEGWVVPESPKTKTGKKVAIVGSGPAGLTCATYLNKLGHKIVVFEKEKMPGGILYYGIPDFKLEKRYVRRRIDILREEGIVFETEVAIGIDIGLQYLMKNFDAIVLAAGALDPRDLSVPGRELSGIHFAMEYLTQQNRLNNHEPVREEERINANGKKVVVVGGGDTGVDCVESANRQDALEIYQIELIPFETSHSTQPGPQDTTILRASELQEKNCVRKWNILTKKFIGENGRVTGIEAVEIEWVQDTAGRIGFSEKANSTFVIPCELALIAVGFVSPGNDELLQNSSVVLNQLGFVEVDENNMTGQEGVFCAGDMANGSSLVIKAIDSGLQTAKSVAKFLN